MNPSKGNPFRLARKRAKLTQTAVASRLGVRPATVVAWEQGTQPQPETLPKIAELYGVSVESLTGPASAGAPQRPAADTDPMALVSLIRVAEWRAEMRTVLRFLKPMMDSVQSVYDQLGEITSSVAGVSKFLEEGVRPAPLLGDPPTLPHEQVGGFGEGQSSGAA